MLALLAVYAGLTGCGLAETTVTAGAAAGSAAQQAKEAARQEEQARKALDSALKTEESLRNEAEARATE
ncbi:MAG: hypothetical protein RLZZ200_2852 [Pseudomonadota bacterium]